MTEHVEQAEVQRLFDYDSSTGELTRKSSIGGGGLKGSVLSSKLDSKGYKRVCINYRTYLQHRIIFLWCHGFLPETVDHINRVKTDNRIENLRAATRSENSVNKSIDRASCSSAFRGVSRFRKKWRANISIANKSVYIGSFADERSAAIAYNEKALSVFGDFAVLNNV